MPIALHINGIDLNGGRCRLAEGEKTNGRWAMAAVAGILGQELLGVTPAWYLHGEKVYSLLVPTCRSSTSTALALKIQLYLSCTHINKLYLRDTYMERRALPFPSLRC